MVSSYVLVKCCTYKPFCHLRYLEETVHFLLPTLRSQREKGTAFQAIGLLAISVRDHIKKYMPRIMEIVRISLPPKEINK